MKIAAMNVIPPTVPSAKNQPAFGDRDDYMMDDWKQTKHDFEDLRDCNESPSLLKKTANLGIFFVSGIITYGTTKFGLTKAHNLLNKKVIGAAKTQEAKASIIKFVSEKVTPKFKKVMTSISEKPFVKSLTEKATAFSKKEKVAPAFDFVKDKSLKIGAKVNSFKAKLGEKFVDANGNELTRLSDGTIKTLSVGSAIAGAVGVENMALDHQNEYCEAC